LLVAAILAAATSNLSAALNSLSSTTVVDFYMGWRSEAEERERMMVSRSSTVMWALVLFAVAVYAVHAGGKGNVVEIGLSIASVAYGCLLGVFLLGTQTKYATQWGAIVGMVTGFVVNAVHTGEDESGLSDEDKLGLEEFLKEAPLSAKAKQDFQRLLTGDKDYFPGLSSDEKKARLARMSYAKYLTDTAGVSDEIVKLLQVFPHPLFGVGIDAVASQDAWGLQLPGFNGLKLDPTPGKGMN